jgi:hypothetical protein
MRSRCSVKLDRIDRVSAMKTSEDSSDIKRIRDHTVQFEPPDPRK